MGYVMRNPAHTAPSQFEATVTPATRNPAIVLRTNTMANVPFTCADVSGRMNRLAPARAANIAVRKTDSASQGDGGTKDRMEAHTAHATVATRIAIRERAAVTIYASKNACDAVSDINEEAAALALNVTLCSRRRKKKAGPITMGNPAKAPPIFGPSFSTASVMPMTMAAVAAMRIESSMTSSAGTRVSASLQGIRRAAREKRSTA